MGASAERAGFDRRAEAPPPAVGLDPAMRHPKAAKTRSHYPRGARHDEVARRPARLPARMTWTRKVAPLRAFPRG